MTEHPFAGVLLDLTPLETSSSLRGIGRYVRGLASGLAAVSRERRLVFEGVAATPDLKKLFLVADPLSYCSRAVTVPGSRSTERRRSLIRSKLASVACGRPGILHLADPNAVPPAGSVTFTLTAHDLIPLVLRQLYLPPIPGWAAAHAAFERARYRRAKRILAVSQATKRDVCELLNIDSNRVDVVWHGVDHAHFHARPAFNERPMLDAIVGGPGPYIIYLGAGDARKDLDTLVAAFAQSHTRRQARLVLAGTVGAKRTRSLARQIRKLRIEDAVHFTGYVPEALVPALYRQSAVHTFLSRYEGFGLPVVEALACGAPTITSAGSSLDEVAGDGALVVPCADVEALASALDVAFFDTERRLELRERGLARAQTFTWQKCAEQTIAFWQRANET